jgi:hypothetical protein
MKIDNRLQRRITISTSILLASTLLLLGVFSLNTPQSVTGSNSAIQDGQAADLPIGKVQNGKAVGAPGAEFRPKSRPFIEIGLIDLSEANQKTKNFSIKTPAQATMPQTFTFRGAIFEGSSRTYTFEGREFTPEIITLLYWNKPLDSGIGYEEFQDGGGIYIRQTYSLGSNQTASELFKKRQSATLTYIHGFPSSVSDGHVELFQTDENVSYDVMGRQYSRDVLLRIMESLIEGP